MYEAQAAEELARWKRKTLKRPSMTNRYAKGIQAKMNQLIPEKVHTIVTASIKNMVHATLIGSEYMTKNKAERGLSLKEREEKVEKITETYRKTAMFEGAGTGAGGILLGIADFPLLLSIKMKFLFETATAYGYDVRDYRERLFILLLFQLAFAREDKKPALIDRIDNWESEYRQLPKEEDYLAHINWKDFQLDYRDYIDLVKLLQLLPGIGAVVGAVANYRLLSVLSETAVNGHRLRIFARH